MKKNTIKFNYNEITTSNAKHSPRNDMNISCVSTDNNHTSIPPYLYTSKKTAFTLAEVLITIGIIGVVSAITMPILVQNHKKSVVANKLKKASSTLMQAYNMSLIDYGDGEREGFEPNNPDTALEMFNKYYVPYIKFLKVEKGQKGVFGYMTDGMVLYFRKAGSPNNWGSTYIIVCIDNKACENIDENEDYKKAVNGKNTFGFYIDGTVPSNQLRKKTHNQLIDGCKNQTSVESCTGLIFKAGWKIPDDYPIRF